MARWGKVLATKPEFEPCKSHGRRRKFPQPFGSPSCARRGTHICTYTNIILKITEKQYFISMRSISPYFVLFISFMVSSFEDKGVLISKFQILPGVGEQHYSAG